MGDLPSSAHIMPCKEESLWLGDGLSMNKVERDYNNSDLLLGDPETSPFKLLGVHSTTIHLPISSYAFDFQTWPAP